MIYVLIIIAEFGHNVRLKNIFYCIRYLSLEESWLNDPVESDVVVYSSL